jgi:hypothetical protein
MRPRVSDDVAHADKTRDAVVRLDHDRPTADAARRRERRAADADKRHSGAIGARVSANTVVLEVSRQLSAQGRKRSVVVDTLRGTAGGLKLRDRPIRVLRQPQHRAEVAAALAKQFVG